MAYLLSNICSKNYWNRTTIVEIIVGGWVVSFFETVYISLVSSPSVPSVCGQTARHAVGRLLTQAEPVLAARTGKAVPWRLVGVVEICRPVNNPPAGGIMLA